MNKPPAGSLPAVIAAVAIALATAGSWVPGRPADSPPRRPGCCTAVFSRIGAQPPESILRRLSQRAPGHRDGRSRVRARRADPGNGARARRGGRGATEHRRGAVGAGDRETRGRLDAAGRPPATHRGGDARSHPLAGDAHRPGRFGEPESGPNRLAASPEPHGVRQRDPRPSRARDRCGGAAARGRDIGHRVRQQRGGPLHLDGATGAVPVGRTEDLAPGHRRHDGARLRALRELGAVDAGGPAERGSAARSPGAASRPRTISRPTATTSSASR